MSRSVASHHGRVRPTSRQYDLDGSIYVIVEEFASGIAKSAFLESLKDHLHLKESPLDRLCYLEVLGPQISQADLDCVDISRYCPDQSCRPAGFVCPALNWTYSATYLRASAHGSLSGLFSMSSSYWLPPSGVGFSHFINCSTESGIFGFSSGIGGIVPPICLPQASVPIDGCTDFVRDCLLGLRHLDSVLAEQRIDWTQCLVFECFVSDASNMQIVRPILDRFSRLKVVRWFDCGIERGLLTRVGLCFCGKSRGGGRV